MASATHGKHRTILISFLYEKTGLNFLHPVFLILNFIRTDSLHLLVSNRASHPRSRPLLRFSPVAVASRSLLRSNARK